MKLLDWSIKIYNFYKIKYLYKLEIHFLKNYINETLIFLPILLHTLPPHPLKKMKRDVISKGNQAWTDTSVACAKTGYIQSPLTS